MQHLYFLHFNNCVVSLNSKMLKNLNFSLGESDLLIERRRRPLAYVVHSRTINGGRHKRRPPLHSILRT